MSELVVRRLLIDLEAPPERHWCGGDAFRTAFFNALSMSFPAGEQLFIDSIKRGLASLPEAERNRFAREAQDFIGQEATHRHLHARLNQQLARQGLVNHWERRIIVRRRRLLESRDDARVWVGVTAATEHWTAIFAQHLLAHPALLEGAEPRWQHLWRWHSAEEIEHRSTAFDLYRALGGNETWRRRLFRVVSFHFVTDVVLQTFGNLWHDGTWRRASTWRSAWRTLFAKGGFVREGFRPWRRYLEPDFHPAQGGGALGESWLSENASLAPPLRPAD